jgi:hypothetical protein
MFDLPADNYPRADLPAGDLARNFNYRRYLSGTTTPFGTEKIVSQRLRDGSNQLAEEWRGSMPDRPAPRASSFVDQAVPYRYFRDIVDKVRAYAKRPLLISAKGIYPFVDLQSVALNDYAPECPLEERTCFLPLGGDRKSGAPLDGSRSLQAAFRSLKATSDAFTGTRRAVPVVLYLDGLWPEYDRLSDQERADYWNIYAAEAYANGLFYAFRLTTGHAPGAHPQTATEGHVIDTMLRLTSFYRDNSPLYHQVAQSDAEVTTSLVAGTVMVSVSDRLGGGIFKRMVHLVNHDYLMRTDENPGGLVRQEDFTVSFPVQGAAGASVSVQLVSPDLIESVDLGKASRIDEEGRITVTVPSLLAYDVIVVSLVPGSY